VPTFAGSPVSHRPITDRLARLTGCAVFSLDYRLMPEHRAWTGIEDCRAAYRWILDNGPEGPAPAASWSSAGDSAGGNLTLSLIAWVRDRGLRQADAAIAFSPATDAVLDAPSLRANIATDPMLGPAFGPGPGAAAPAALVPAGFTRACGPRIPRVSPLRGPSTTCRRC
jgi:monoterpene epsilon-lactone hydrolase